VLVVGDGSKSAGGRPPVAAGALEGRPPTEVRALEERTAVAARVLEGRPAAGGERVLPGGGSGFVAD
jgi:hypothetical protein